MKIEDLIEPELKLFNSIIPHHQSSNPTFIPIHLNGGIGDVVMSLDGIRALQKKYQILVYTPHIEAFRYFEKNISVFPGMPDYDWHLEYNTIAKFHFRDTFHGFLIKDHEHLFLRQQQIFKDDPKIKRLIKSDYNKFFLISIYAREKSLHRAEFPMKCLGFDIGFDPEPKKYGRENYITIHDGFDTQHASLIKGRATKTWDLNHWKTLISQIREKYPDYRIIQLGSSTSRPIEGVTQCLIKKTTIREAFDILSESKLHIDGDSGLVHAATRMQVPCIVLWGPTPHYFYGYKQNINIKSNVCKEACYGIKENWHDQCPIGYETPKCMDEISPASILEKIARIF